MTVESLWQKNICGSRIFVAEQGHKFEDGDTDRAQKHVFKTTSKFNHVANSETKRFKLPKLTNSSVSLVPQSKCHCDAIVS